MARVEVDISPTLESAPSLLMEIATLLEAFNHAPQLNAPTSVPTSNDTGEELINVWVKKRGRALHTRPDCGHGRRSGEQGNVLGLFMTKRDAARLKRTRSDFLCDYCWRLGKRKATYASRKEHAEHMLPPLKAERIEAPGGIFNFGSGNPA